MGYSEQARSNHRTVLTLVFPGVVVESQAASADHHAPATSTGTPGGEDLHRQVTASFTTTTTSTDTQHRDPQRGTLQMLNSFI